MLGSPESNVAVVPFRDRLRELGYTEGQNVALESRYARGQEDHLPGLAAELARIKLDAIFAAGDQAVIAAKHATRTIPIVMVACDAVASGIVSSLAKPGGNITGITCVSSEIAGKRIALLKEVTPKLARLGVVWNPGDPGKSIEWKDTQIAAQARRMTIQSLEVRTASETDGLPGAITRAQLDALVVLGDALTINNRARVVEIVAKSRLPVMYGYRVFVDSGGMIAYGPSLVDMYRRAAEYVDRILKGAKRADLPVEQLTKFELVIMKTAKALGLTIPPSLLPEADQVIE